MANIEIIATPQKPRTVKVLMLTVTEPLANVLFGWANVVLIFGAAAVLVGTIGAIAMGSAKEQFSNERISANEAETARAKEAAAGANARAFEAQLALASFRAPRTLSAEQQAAITAVAARHKGTPIDIFMAGDSADIRPLAETFARLLKNGGQWQPEFWTWVGVGPIERVVALVKKGAHPASVAAATDLLKALDGPAAAKPQEWPGEWKTFGGMLNGPPFSPDRSEIRLVIGSKPP
jgi:hypothetical protein